MNVKIAVGAVLVLALGAWFWGSSGEVAASVDDTGELFEVRRDDLRITITENGTMVAKESKKVEPKLRGQGKITFLVEEGKVVEQDEIVCKLDPTSLEERIESLQLEILQTETSLKTARREHEITEVENVANKAKAGVALERAQKELEKYRDGEAPQQHKKLEVAIKDAETDFNRKKKNLEDSQKLLAENFIRKSELEDHQIDFERATVQKEGADLDLMIFDKYTYPMQMADLQTKVADATRDVETTAKRAESTLEQKAVTVQSNEKRLKAQQKQLEERKEELENMSLKAPCPGIVVYGDPHQPWYREDIKVGGEIWGGHTVMTIPDLRVMQVKVEVHEADIDKVAVGQKAVVTMDTYLGMTLEGEVSKIASIAGGQNQWGGSGQVKKFDVEITIMAESLDKTLRPGISAKAEIQIETRTGVLFVPLQSVFAEDGEQFCHVMESDKGPQRRKVEIGAANENYVEITAGLVEGEKVLLYNPLMPEFGGRKDEAGAEDAKSPDQGGAKSGSTGTPVEASASKGGG
ncbi:MAG: HlyD family efflux transporter periplasmic adaptor subunit [Planctomycetes bacterium]|nr:HlyD family efflux transporter periplasmic adaptor subunit [Planctomycetota bacterium]